MANRFLDTNYYKSTFVRGLKGHLKSLYSFIICDCDGAGIWNMDLESAGMFTGFNILFDEFKENFIETGKAIEISNGKYFFPDFIDHQYPSGLQATNKAHKNFITTLTKYGLIDPNQKIIKKEAPLKEPLKGSHVQSSNGNGLGNGNSHGLDKEGSGEPKKVTPEFHTKTLTGQMVELWGTAFPSYSKDPERDLPALKCIADFIFQQSNVKDGYGNADNEIKCLNTFQLIADQVNRENFWVNKPLKSISSHIQEFYNKIKNPTSNGNSRTAGKNGSKLDDNILKQKLDERRHTRQQNGSNKAFE